MSLPFARVFPPTRPFVNPIIDLRIQCLSAQLARPNLQARNTLDPSAGGDRMEHAVTT